MNRPRSLRLVRIGILTAVLASGSVAIAATATTGDPISVAQGSADAALTILTTYGPVIGGMYLLYALSSALLSRYSSSSFLAQGKRLAITTGALGVAGAALQAQLAGSSWTLILAAATAAAFKLLTPTVTPAPAPRSRTPKTSAPITAALLLVMVACAGGQRVAAGVTAGLECEAPNIQNAVTQLLPALIKLVGTALRGDGTFDRSILQAIAQPFKNSEFQCAMDAAIAATASGSTPAPATGTAAAPAPRATTATAIQLRDAWAGVRGDLGWLPPASSQPAP